MPQPKRIQRKRTKGWRLPEGAVCVSRPSKWGNPWRVGDDRSWTVGPGRVINREPHGPLTRQQAIESYRQSILGDPDWIALIREHLAGRDLACWCRLVDDDGEPVPCHADVLLELANAKP